VLVVDMCKQVTNYGLKSRVRNPRAPTPTIASTPELLAGWLWFCFSFHCYYYLLYYLL
jgi:hypothetical protein